MIQARLTAVTARHVHAGPPVQLIRLELPASFDFAAGQYVNVLPDGESRLPLSIASAPAALPQLDLHYRSTAGVDEAQRMDQFLELSASGSTLSLEGPFGDVRLPPPGHLPVLICGGTGAAQAVGMARALADRDPAADYILLACADHEADFYFSDLLPASGHKTFIADDNRTDTNRSLAWLRANRDRIDAGGTGRCVLSGSPAFVYALTDLLTELGFASERLSSDVYAYAPR